MSKPDSAASKKRGPKRSARREAADSAGVSRSWVWRAAQVASIPEDEFEELVESDEPPTVSALVEIGRHRRQLPERGAQGRRLTRCPHCGGDLTGGDE